MVRRNFIKGTLFIVVKLTLGLNTVSFVVSLKNS